jgi:hypothetical protein
MYIKNSIATGLLLLLVCSMATAQASFIHVGYAFSAGISDIATSPGAAPSFLGYEVKSFKGRKPKPAIQFGIWHSRSLNSRLSFSTELLLSREGLIYESKTHYGTNGYNLNNYYLHLPLAIHLRTNIAKKKHSAVYISPYAATLLLSFREVYSLDYYQKDRPENMKRFTYGAGIGYLWDIGKSPGSWFIDLRYSYGISSSLRLLENSSPAYYSEGILFARNTSAMLGLKYML